MAQFTSIDHPSFQHNPPNPILIACRIDLDSRLPYWTRADIIKRWAGENGLSARSGEYPTYSAIWTLRQAYPQAVDHARRVLTRLASLTNDKEQA